MPAFPSQWLGLKAQRILDLQRYLRSRLWSVLFWCFYFFQKLGEKLGMVGVCLKFLFVSVEAKTRVAPEHRCLRLAWATD